MLTHWEKWLTAGLRAAKAGEQKNPARRLQRSLGEYYQWQGQIQLAEKMLRESLTIAEELLSSATTDNEKDDGQRGVAVTQSSLADLLSNRGQYEEAERLYRESLTVKEEIGDRREVAVTQSSLAALLSNRGQYEEAERLYQSGLAICYEVQELQGIGVFLLGLGQLAQAQGNPDEALAKFREAQQQFVAIGLTNWAAQVEQLIRQVQGEAQGLTLDDVLALIKSAQNGNQEAGQQAWQISQSLKQSNDYAMSALGQALESILAGESPETATTNLPPDLRTAIVQALT